jgi:hypothetical protein
MVDMMRTMIDELGFVRPHALVSELLVTDSHEQVCSALLRVIWLTKAHHNSVNYSTTSREGNTIFLS